MTATTQSRPRATERGLALLRVVADNPEGVTLADAARAVDLTPSTALRQLRSLESSGFATRHDDGRYAPGPELLRIARSLSTDVLLPRLAQPVLVSLSQRTGESAYLAEAVDRRTAVYSAMQPGRHAVRHVSWLGQHVPLHTTAIGAALAGRVDADGAAARTDAVEHGVMAIAAPVLDASGAVTAAVSVVGPTYRVGPAEPAIRAAVVQAAQSLSTRAAHPGSSGARSRLRSHAPTH